MWPFRRRPKGRHALGAAVTGIPALLPPVAAPLPPAPVVEAPALVPPPVPEYVPPPLPAEPHRVELGFRDGSTAALAPGSEQAKALTELADLLTHRD